MKTWGILRHGLRWAPLVLVGGVGLSASYGLWRSIRPDVPAPPTDSPPAVALRPFPVQRPFKLERLPPVDGEPRAALARLPHVVPETTRPATPQGRSVLSLLSGSSGPPIFLTPSATPQVDVDSHEGLAGPSFGESANAPPPSATASRDALPSEDAYADLGSTDLPAEVPAVEFALDRQVAEQQERRDWLVSLGLDDAAEELDWRNGVLVAQAQPGSSGAGDGAQPPRDRPIGEKPADDANRLLVLNTGVLLPDGTWQTEVGGLYSRSQTPNVVIVPTAVLLERLRSRRFLMPLTARYGWRGDNELFLTVPFGWAHFERDASLFEFNDATGVMGDLSFGIIHQLDLKFLQEKHKDRKLPDVTASFSVRAPTGTHPFRNTSANLASLGSGFWQFSARVNFTQSFDPIVIFAGLGYDYQLPDQYNGVTIEPGDSFNYYVGLGFGVSDDVSLSATLSGAYVDRISFDGIDVANSDSEPISIRLSYLRRLSRTDRIQPFVDFGITPDSSDVTFGILYVHTHEKK